METNWELIGKYISGECTTEEKVEMESWLQKSAENQNLFESLKKFSKKPKNETNLNFGDFKAQDWETISNKIFDKSLRLNSWSMVWKVAASITILIVSIWTIYSFIANEKPLLVVETTDTIQEVWLSDSTYVYLNKNSRLEVKNEYNLKERNIELQGEAYFKVKPNKEAPFSIASHSVTTTVLGTSFNVKAYSDTAINVSVEEGKVLVLANTTKKVLTASMSVSYTPQGLFLGSTTNTNFLAWKTGIIRFDNESIHNVARFLSDYYNNKISIKSKDVSNLNISVELNQLTLEEALEVITFTLDLNFRNSPEGYEIY